MELEPQRKFRLLPTGAEFDGDISFAEWEEAGNDLLTIHKMTPVWIGDWLCAGESRFGETYSQAMTITGLAVDTLAHYKSTMGRIPQENRQPGLSFSHYRVVDHLEPIEQKLTLELAVKEKLSVRQLKETVGGGPEKLRPKPHCFVCGSSGEPLYTLCHQCKGNQTGE